MENNNKPKSKSKKVIPFILGAIILIGGFFGVKEYIYFSNHVDTDDAQIDGDISPVVSRVGGYIDSIYFEENQHVNAGQLLVKLDDRDYKIKLEQAQAGKQSALANVNVSETVVSSTSANIATARANVNAASARAEKASKDFVRYQNLIKDGSITQQQFDQAKAEKETASAQLEAAKAQFAAAQKQVNTSESQVSAANSNISSRTADIDFAKLQLSYTKITAPSSGIVSNKNIQIGQLIQPGQSLFAVVNDNSLYVKANFKETQLEKLKEGQLVDVVVDAYPDVDLKGHIYNFAPATGAKFSLLPPDNATGNYVKVIQRVPVKIKLEKNKILDKLRPGMSVKASVHISE
ncbi:HlyD family secretion protein [Pedobacter sp. SD-b]|uniref:HlyD family secretion protein n=1 Tax=Pedobacter segetis TaxID=2793069 RepID=A0ABS1BJP8_9SPHI|nr:HlyD family secretion protein [Pedobacter segetis]MBK0383107.1 HlyD family secretion protein [Pedobacter segetis]